ncbi:MAG: HAD family hydrolase [Solirubrobacteraceae bacterium]
MSDAQAAHASRPAGEQIEIVLFDIGGVLARFAGLAVLKQLTGSESELDVAARWLMSPWVRRFESGGCTDEEFATGIVEEWQLPYSATQFLEIFPTWLDDPFDGAEQMVRATAARVGVGCLSNTNSLQWHGMISRWPLSQYFEHRFLSFELRAVKPDREIYERVIERLPVSPANVLFLDDNPLNIEGATAAGLRAEPADGVAQARAVLERYGLLVG